MNYVLFFVNFCKVPKSAVVRVGLIVVCYFRKNTVCLSGAVFFEATNFYRAGQHSVDLYVIFFRSLKLSYSYVYLIKHNTFIYQETNVITIVLIDYHLYHPIQWNNELHCYCTTLLHGIMFSVYITLWL